MTTHQLAIVVTIRESGEEQQVGDPGWAGVAISLLIGVAVSYYFFRKGRERVRLMYWFRDTALVGAKGGADDPIGILFEDQTVPRVNKAELYIWNGGTKTAAGADIVGSDPLRVTLPDDERLLRARVTSTTRPVNSIAVEELPHEAVISFDYLDPGDGAVVEILHTARRSSDRRLEGTLRGLPKGPEVASTRTMRPRRVNWVALAFMALALATVIGAAVTDERPSPEDRQVQRIIDSLPPDDRERLVEHLTDAEALPGEEAVGDGFFFVTGGLIFVVALGVQVASSSGNRLPKALGVAVGSDDEEKQ